MNTAIYQGVLAGLGLILMIGSQDIFIMRQGIQRNHVFLVTTVTVLADAFLVILGVNGLGALIQNSAVLKLITMIAGTLFLLGYGIHAFYEMFKQKKLEIHGYQKGITREWQQVVLMALTFNICNPHAWLDATVILGSIGGQLDTAIERYAFTLGSIGILSIWFYLLAFGAWKLAPFLRKPLTWKILNFLTGCVMFGIAAILVMEYFETRL